MMVLGKNPPGKKSPPLWGVRVRIRLGIGLGLASGGGGFPGGFFPFLLWPTQYTTIYVTFKGLKLGGQFSEKLVLWFYEFLFNSDIKIFKEKRIIPAGIYLFKVNNRNTKTRCKICSKLTIKIPERRHWHLRLFFVRIKQTSKSRSSEAPIQMSS